MNNPPEDWLTKDFENLFLALAEKRGATKNSLIICPISGQGYRKRKNSGSESLENRQMLKENPFFLNTARLTCLVSKIKLLNQSVWLTKLPPLKNPLSLQRLVNSQSPRHL